MTYKMGVIADTHGLLRPQVFSHFHDMDLIIHAGDLGKPEVLSDLKAITKTVAVRGNVDYPYIFPKLKYTETVEILDRKIYVIHNINMLAVDPSKDEIDMVIYGHSHKPAVEEKNGIRYFNPGSAGPKRFSLPISIGIIIVSTSQMTVQHIDLS